MRGKFLTVAVLVMASTAASIAASATLEVPAQYPTVAAALAEAGAGDTVKLAPGRYYEHDLVIPVNITLTGPDDDPEACIIDAQGQGRILSLQNVAGTTAIRYLTFTNGHASMDEGYEDSGGAIYVNGSGVLIANCRFLNNRAEASGGAVRGMRTSMLIRSSLFQGNSAGESGGALDFSYSVDSNVSGSRFVDNSAANGGALSCRGASSPDFTNCIFDGNQSEGDMAYGGAVLSFFWGSPSFESCTFSRNSADLGGALFNDTNSPANLTSCTIAANTAFSRGAGIYTENATPRIKTSIIAFQNGEGLLSLGTSLPQITCTNIYGNTGGDWIGGIAPQASQDGNMSVDPLFCEAELGEDDEFNLQEGSPCTIAGGACADLGAGDIGCSEPMFSGEAKLSVVWDGGLPVIHWEITGYRGPLTFRLARTSVQHQDQEQDIPYEVTDEGGFRAVDTDFVPVANEDYYYRLYLVSEDGSELLLGTVDLTTPPREFTLGDVGVWPNPFNPQTSIHFELAASQKVRIDIYGLDGRRIRTLAEEVFQAGPRSVAWDGQDDGGRPLASGAYFVVVRGEQETKRLKVTLLK